MRLLLALTLAAGLFACDDDDSSTGTPEPQPEAEPAPQPEAEPEPQADLSCAETDFGGTGWLGPAVTDGAPALDPEATYHVSTTVLYLRPGDAAFTTFNTKLGPIVGSLGEMDGLLAYHFGGSERCGSQRTITIWRDVEAMYRFVAHPSHTDAMAVTSEVSLAALTDAWESSGADVPTDWETYKARLRE